MTVSYGYHMHNSIHMLTMKIHVYTMVIIAPKSLQSITTQFLLDQAYFSLLNIDPFLSDSLLLKLRQ